MSLDLAENLQRHINLLLGKIARKNELLGDNEKELAQKEARIEQLENHIGETEAFTHAGYGMSKFKEMTARIRELEDLLEYIYLNMERTKGDTLGSILLLIANIQANICVELGRTPEENDLWQNLSDKSNQSETEERNG